MKGIVFTEFFSLVEELYGLDMVDDLIDDTDLPSSGAYTAVGTYSHEEMAALVTALSKRTDTPIPALLQTFGKALFKRFSELYPHFFEKATDAYDFLQKVETYIHIEVLKLYPDAELPRFETMHASPNRLELLYTSTRHLEDFAHGLMLGALEHFDDTSSISRTPEANGTRFILERN